MLSIGLVDLDTSHPRSFAKRLNAQDGVKVVGAFDAGAVRSDEEVGQFCKDFDCRRFDTLDEMAEAVDAAAVLSVDWNVHVSRAKPFLRAGVPVYIDKPLAGSVAELDEFVALAAETKTPVLAGSGWRFNEPIRRAREKFAGSDIGEIFAFIDHNYFFYGIHLTEMVLGLLGPGIETVHLLTMDDGAHVLYFTHKRGASGYLYMQASCVTRTLWFSADGKRQSVSLELDDIHDGICQKFLGIARGEKMPLSPADLTESPRVMLAGFESFKRSEPVVVASLPAGAHCDSTEFMKIYRSL